jgi:hypothetical protein
LDDGEDVAEMSREYIVFWRGNTYHGINTPTLKVSALTLLSNDAMIINEKVAMEIVDNDDHCNRPVDADLIPMHLFTSLQYTHALAYH